MSSHKHCIVFKECRRSITMSVRYILIASYSLTSRLTVTGKICNANRVFVVFIVVTIT